MMMLLWLLQIFSCVCVTWAARGRIECRRRRHRPCPTSKCALLNSETGGGVRQDYTPRACTSGLSLAPLDAMDAVAISEWDARA
ncbi:hypothetical protein K466DRAFT_584442 [Polyporus arcularius HHB13444]|uniref:Secreted protein n=1 Tax=Polyporus arcularius HHB13444 TaxID=1314778 RepID=A0A5C3PMX2_9APHY|nr:hypothetical protein K466DRAFT_584442 [Polyporus arcularius HHB13444]